ncbi:MAG TPA: adenylyltransferase/cytidyltransferase family protein [Chloroflexota bacterium]
MHQKFLSLSQLAKRSRSIRESDRRLVLTNGCFDLLHLGHVRYLQQARQLGDALAVAINSDISVRRLKGAGRPITPEGERAEILAALECVDFVTIFDGGTAEAVVGRIKPTIYVKGGDYSPDPNDPNFPPEGHVAQAYGGGVAVLPYVPGHSTTALLDMICDRERRAD